MRSVRYRIVTLCSVLLALAAGIILGDGPLQGERAVAAVSGSGDRDELAAAQRQIAAQRSELEFADSFATAAGADLVARTLAGRAVTVVTLPGADPRAVQRAVSTVGTAGGTIAAQVALTPDLLDVAQRQMVSELARQMDVGATRSAVDAPKDGGDYTVVSAMLAYALLTEDDGGDQPDRVSDGILAGLTTAKLVSLAPDAAGEAALTRRGSVALVVGGAPYGSADERAGAGSILNEVLAAFDATGDGTVLEAPTSASAPDGLLTAVRLERSVARRVSLVDVADRAAGAVLAVLALAADVAGQPGDWGSPASADGPLPGAAGDEAAPPEKADGKKKAGTKSRTRKSRR